MSKHTIMLFGVTIIFASVLHSYAQTSATAPATGPSTSQPATQPSDPFRQDRLVGRAQELFNNMIGGDFNKAVVHFDKTMNKDLPPITLAEKWKEHTTKFGVLKDRRDVRLDKWREYDIVIINCEFAKADFNAEILFDSRDQISGLFFTLIYQKPDYVDRSKFREEEIEFGKSSALALPGTLSLPVGKGPFPVVVLVHGLGPHDRDQTIGSNKPLRDFAHGLASKGIATLRYVKRTKQYPDKVADLSAVMERLGQKGFTVKEETLDDVKEAVFYVRHRSEINGNKVFILGHSMGGTLLPRIANEMWGLGGLIIAAGPTRPLEDVILAQETYLTSLDGKVTEEEKKKLDALKAQVARVKDPNLEAATPAEDLPYNLTAVYWMDLRAYQAAETAKNLYCPILVLQGGKDFQITKEDFEGWKKALSHREDVQFNSYPRLNHLFMDSEAKEVSDYYTKAGNVDRQVIEDIAGWIKNQMGK
ncbi:MAG: alpha/beta fold hydrolase [Planctomycetota bacterium]|nr:MAG: alpha/beta fold hydrolase [Planctomycetota bacterium]